MLSLRESEPGLPWGVVSGAGEGVSVSIDPNGNTASDGSKTYVWDAENRLVEVKQGGNTLATFAYDGQGRRAAKSAGGTTTSFVYDGVQFLEERPTGGTTKRYFYDLGIDRPLAEATGATTAYFSADHLGSIAQVTDAAGAPILTREYDAWGNLLQGSAVSGYAFTGREWDAETSLYYYRARYYDPKAGRFISEDPIGFGGGDVGLYSYVWNAPTSFVDPLGLVGLLPPPSASQAAAAAQGTKRFWEDAGGAAGSMWENYNRMTDANTRGADRYYHCMANCQGAQQGAGGRFTTEVVSYAREVYGVVKWAVWDTWRSQTSWSEHARDTNRDTQANDWGRDAGCAGRDCFRECAIFLPRLPQGFPF